MSIGFSLFTGKINSAQPFTFPFSWCFRLAISTRWRESLWRSTSWFQTWPSRKQCRPIWKSTAGPTSWTVRCRLWCVPGALLSADCWLLLLMNARRRVTFCDYNHMSVWYRLRLDCSIHWLSSKLSCNCRHRPIGANVHKHSRLE